VKWELMVKHDMHTYMSAFRRMYTHRVASCIPIYWSQETWEDGCMQEGERIKEENELKKWAFLPFPSTTSLHFSILLLYQLLPVLYYCSSFIDPSILAKMHGYIYATSFCYYSGPSHSNVVVHAWFHVILFLLLISLW